MRKTDAQTRVQAHTLTSEIYFSVQILDLRGQAKLEQVQAVREDGGTIKKHGMNTSAADVKRLHKNGNNTETNTQKTIPLLRLGHTVVVIITTSVPQ